MLTNLLIEFEELKGGKAPWSSRCKDVFMDTKSAAFVKDFYNV